ncbi:hypothetical protein [Polaromonas sp.]|uniref:hypothetical protein n=1 Tax=Polaromonas sp. TaxID=1869339 RepID=UPI000BCE8D22|nr:hypothetical protein [Polaromonas sp.]OYY31923.1 MAG: hypothetical protein B7Y60_23740 [Polaromonas sp. 35-63-35]OYZ13477.1 MAG: hypothetical protein B7Y28_23730 [Polaromonas sp. 16-63-31]OYZ75322.1 MAG: hypothetical protein B7Y09_24575 [Polaromonas sp. 24-63-21]OZA45303.1 MAG: hypothetical protein B7X88_24775 [Polaromonas sp. 17-63-33]OZA84955.1 MAG: hypothetical protein B7X65_23470 [Polaromonas sp. 39-63-25]
MSIKLSTKIPPFSISWWIRWKRPARDSRENAAWLVKPWHPLRKLAIATTPASQRKGLEAGMQVAAEIHQGRRTIMEYLLSPVQKVSAEAGRER